MFSVLSYRGKIIGPWAEAEDVVDIPVGAEVNVDVEVDKPVGEYTIRAGNKWVERLIMRTYGEKVGATFSVPEGTPTVFYSENGKVVLGLQYTARKIAQLRSHIRYHEVSGVDHPVGVEEFNHEW